jgi:ABC-type multidrug transport system fused ATPase/permease subunit
MKVSMDRIRDFLKETELEKYGQSEPIFQQTDSTIGFKSGKFVYHGTPVDSSQLLDNALPNGSGFSLRDLDVEFPAGKMSVICGSTGSGIRSSYHR